MTPAFAAAIDAVGVLGRVRARLEAGGAVIELGILERMSVEELNLLVRREVE